MHPRKILHPTDYTKHSEPALRTAAEFAHDHAAELVILHVVETLGPENLPYGEVAAHPQPEAYRKRLWEEIHKVQLPHPVTHVVYVLSEEDPVTAILRTAEELHCDLIVLGSHGVTGWRRWFVSSVAEEVVRRADCPVLVVKVPSHHAPLPPVARTDLHPGYLVEDGHEQEGGNT
jgi:nucleotide-binding universal stress UspA family protein